MSARIAGLGFAAALVVMVVVWALQSGSPEVTPFSEPGLSDPGVDAGRGPRSSSVDETSSEAVLARREPSGVPQGSRPMELPVDPGGQESPIERLMGRVVDADTGESIAGAEVLAHPASGDGWDPGGLRRAPVLCAATSGLDGGFALDLSVGEVVQLDVRHPGYWPLITGLQPRGGKPVVVPLRSLKKQRLRVVAHEDGHPIRGAVVDVSGRGVSVQTRTDSLGRTELRLPDSCLGLLVTVTARGYWQRSLNSEQWAGLGDRDRTVELARGDLGRLRILDDKGSPVARATVSSWVLRTTVSDEQGWAHWDELPPADASLGDEVWPVRIDAPGFQTCFVALLGSELRSQEGVIQSLAPCLSAHGVVVDPQGRPLRGVRVVYRAKVILRPKSAASSAVFLQGHDGEVDSGDDGRFSFPAVAGQAYALAMSRDGSGSKISAGVPREPAMDLGSFVLSSEGALRGQVLGFGSSENLRVSLEAHCPAVLWRGQRDSVPVRSIPCPPTGELCFSKLSAGRYRLVLERGREVLVQSLVEVTEGNTTEFQLDASRGSFLVGRVQRAPGMEQGAEQGAKQIRLKVTAMDSSGAAVSSRFVTPQGEFRVPVDSEGPYQIVVEEFRGTATPVRRHNVVAGIPCQVTIGRGAP